MTVDGWSHSEVTLCFVIYSFEAQRLDPWSLASSVSRLIVGNRKIPYLVLWAEPFLTALGVDTS